MKSFNNYLDSFKKEYKELIAFKWVKDYNTKEICTKTYEELYKDVCRFVNYYNLKNISFDNKHIGIISFNCYNYVVNILGIISMGGTVVPINYYEKTEQINSNINYADIEYVVIDEMCKAKITTNNTACFCISDYEECNNDNDIEISEFNLEKTIAMIFTSGTTGKSKCAMLSFKNFYNTYLIIDEIANEAHNKKNVKINSFLFMAPLYHALGFADIVAFTYAGYTIDMCYDIKKIDSDLKILKSQVVITVPVVVERWAKKIENKDDEALHNLKLIACGGSSLPEKTIESFNALGIDVYNTYGMTESSTTGMYCLIKKDTPGNMLGKAEKGVEVSIINGEICLRGDGVMKGYYKGEDKDSIITDGWLHTGDLGYIKDENVYLSGRKKNLIILSSGENVNPEELERIVLINPKVKEVMVKEVDGKIGCEIYCDVSAYGEVKEYIKGINRTLPLYKHIGDIKFRDKEFDKNSGGKLIRK